MDDSLLTIQCTTLKMRELRGMMVGVVHEILPPSRLERMD